MVIINPTAAVSVVLASMLMASCAPALSEAQAQAHFAELKARAVTSGRLVVHITGVEVAQGSLRVGLYDAMLPFPTEGLHLTNAVQPAMAGKNEVTFENVPAGKYALAVIHDVNGDGRLARTMGVFPAEPLGFSRGAKAGAFGPPGFDDASFDFQPGAAPVVVELGK